MKGQMIILAAVFAGAHAGAALAQTATGTGTTLPTAATASGTTPTTNHAGAYDALSEGNRKIVSAIYEAQLGSPKDAGAGTLLSRDEIAAMREKTGWGNIYRQLHEKGMVTEKNLGQAVSSYNHSVKAGGSNYTVISTAGGEQIAIKKDKPGSAAAPDGKAGPAANANNATAKASPAKAAAITTAGGDTATASASAPSSTGGANGNRLTGAAKAK